MSNDKKINEDDLKVLYLVHNNPEISQRRIAEQMGFSLGKVNYCIKALTEVGFIKCKSFLNHKNKLGYLYILTPKALSEKTSLTKIFLQKKQLEYEKLYNYFHEQ
jgi:EPS-associated MarR family transcriptional regulator